MNVMNESDLRPSLEKARSEFEVLVREIRPELHRYCARMTGSSIDGEDVLQDTLAKAFYLLPQTQQISNLRSWLFRIAHNKAVDFTRGYARRFGEPLEEHTGIAADSSPIDNQELAKMGLALFMKLTPVQRGAIILKDVLEHSLTEIAEILDTSVPSIKGALHRGRASLRRLAQEAGDDGPDLDRKEVNLLEGYVKHFAAREFDQLRMLLARDVRLDVVGIVQNRGAEQVGGYFHRYDGLQGWRPAMGLVEGRPAILVYDLREGSATPAYFILIEWADGEVMRIRDYRYSRYMMTDVSYVAL
jgi:RNA polymerase sigma-70 factor (ECF subfamily)